MSILVKGMEMPKSCLECVCKHKFFSDMRCYEFSDFEFDGTEKFPHSEDRSLYCPLVLVPPHGKVVDADALIMEKAVVVNTDEECYQYVLTEDIANAPTIIEADKEGTEK